MPLWSTILIPACFAFAAEPARIGLPAPFVASETHVEVIPTENGSDLITFFRNDVPQVTILLDTLHDSRPEGHRFRQVWAYTYVRPNWKQHLAAAVPFFYHRAGSNKGDLNAAPKPIFNISEPSKGTLPRIGEAFAQSNFFDSFGAYVRAPTRAYRGNTGEYRNMHLARSLEIVDTAIKNPDLIPGEMQGENWDQVSGRLQLGQRLLGGYVSDEYAETAGVANQLESDENRGSNWDFLRQFAEQNGLYIEPLLAEQGTPHQAVLWFADSTAAHEPTRFNDAILESGNPWKDARIRNWKGYTRTWYLDADGMRLSESEPTAVATRMIPLAVYALDYPGVPLLLIDFRSSRAKRREVIRRATEQVTTGVFGITPYTALSWFTAREAYLFVQNRHGHALNRGERLNSYARLQQVLLDNKTTIDPPFHELLEGKLDELALNPFEQSGAAEDELAKRQYAALLHWSASPGGLVKSLDRARAAEFAKKTKSGTERAFTRVARVATFGALPSRHALSPEQLQALDRYRRLDADLAFLREVDRSPNPEVEWSADRILAAASNAETAVQPGSEEADMIARVRGKVPPTVAHNSGSGRAGAFAGQ